MRMPLSYCSIACAIQPTVRPTTNSANALPSGSPSARTAAPSAKSTFGYWPVSSFAANDGGGDAGAASGPRRGDRLQDSAGARIALGIERVAEPRQILAACEPRRHYRHRLGAVADLAEQRLGARRGAAVPPPGQGTERRRDDGVRGRAGRGNDAGDKSRRVQLVVGQQHENAADQIGARLCRGPRQRRADSVPGDWRIRRRYRRRRSRRRVRPGSRARSGRSRPASGRAPRGPGRRASPA